MTEKTQTVLLEARADYSAGRWREAREKFSAAQAAEALVTADLLALGDCAWWLGLNDEALAAFEKAFQRMVADDDEPEAAKLALELGFLWFLRGEHSIAELCRREGIAEGLYYSWSKEFLEAGKRRLAGDTARAATSDEVKDLRRQAQDLKEVVAEQALELRLLKKSMLADGGDEA